MKPHHPDDGTYCPQWRKPCHKVCHTCKWYTMIPYWKPETRTQVERWDCAIAHGSGLQFEMLGAERQTTATVDALREEVQQGNDASLVNTLDRLNDKLDDAQGSVARPLLGN